MLHVEVKKEEDLKTFLSIKELFSQTESLKSLLFSTPLRIYYIHLTGVALQDGD